MDFGILQVIESHKGDVRKVAPYPNGGVLTGSRDHTAKLYQPDESKELYEVQNFIGPTEFVSSICYGKTKDGNLEIYVGCHDQNIYIYTLMESKSVTTLTRHSGPVCALAFRICNDQDVLVSGGWDGNAIVWRDKKPELILMADTHAVWSVAFVARSFLLTGGADRMIR